MKKEIVNPYVGNFIKSLRDVGYTFEIAVADVMDNSIDAGAKNIKISILPKPKPIFAMFDNGIGMNEKELIEAMRLASKDPNKHRGKKVLGKFGLGLKTASFSQCKKLTVISKKDCQINIRQWDLDYISRENEWLLIEPKISDYQDKPFWKNLEKIRNGTIVIWEEMDRYGEEEYSDLIDSLRDHISLTFHRFLEGGKGNKKIIVEINESVIHPFNPFNSESKVTQELPEEKIKLYGETIKIQPCILPHHSKVSQSDYKKYGTKEGYTKAQGFYLYRANRLLIHGTWLGLHKISDAHKLVRIKVEIPNNQDEHWGIDIKKSKAKPVKAITDDLRRIINTVTEKGSRPYTGRGKRILDKSVKRFWELIPVDGGIRFGLSKTHPLYEQILKGMDKDQKEVFNLYLNGLEAYIPLNAIQAKLNQNPHEIKQDTAIKKEEISTLMEKLKDLNLDPEYIEELMKTELFK